jgi:hypothetical protein
MSTAIDGKTILVTGANRGIGQASGPSTSLSTTRACSCSMTSATARRSSATCRSTCSAPTR